MHITCAATIENAPAPILPTATLPELMTVKEVAKHFKISKTTQYRKLKTGEIKARKVGIRTYIIVATVQAMIANLPLFVSKAA